MPVEENPLTTIGRTPDQVELLKVENGWVIRIGCKTFVEKEWEAITVGLKEYFDNPKEAQKKYCKEKTL